MKKFPLATSYLAVLADSNDAPTDPETYYEDEDLSLLAYELVTDAIADGDLLLASLDGEFPAELRAEIEANRADLARVR